MSSEKYKQYLISSKYSEGTIKNYMYYFEELALEGAEIDLNAKAPVEIIHFLVSTHNTKEYRAFLKTVTKCFGCRYDNLNIPTIKGRTKETQITYYTPQEINKILDVIQTEKLKIIVLLMYESGLRVSEVMNLQLKNINLIDNKIRGIGKGNIEFVLPFSQKTAYLIKKYIYEMEKYAENPYIDGSKYIFRYLTVENQRQKVWYEIRKLQPIIPHKRLFPHGFRHSTGTNLRSNRVDLRDIQDYLRHKRISTTQMYTAVDKEKIGKQAIKILGGQNE